MEDSLEENMVTSTSEEKSIPENVFKKPILFGKIGKLPKKLPTQVLENPDIPEKIIPQVPDQTSEDSQKQKPAAPLQAPVHKLADGSTILPYKEPPWSGLPESSGKDYVFEVLKNGAIIESINLMSRPFWLFGRLPNCDVYMQHPTISRYHAVLQYRQEMSGSQEPGFYIYDLGSTHGTFLNKNRVKPKVYVRIQVGHMLKLGCSTRSYILTGPEYDAEEESEMSVTELKQKREEDLRRHEEERLRIENELKEKKKREEERGVDWGLGEDADEETDLSENPYAQTTNEELYLDDPKKALRGFFEREGLNLEYNCSEQGIGQFLCKVELPLDDEMGRPIVAEVLHKGKKKESVIQCALEACRILDRYGVLRQATHESRKRKAKNWEENDYYDSDEDTFLDRTGTIEKKREKRMHAKAPQSVETYDSLMDKDRLISKKLLELESQLESLEDKNAANDVETTEEDPLDVFMKGLSDTKTNKKAIFSLKTEITQLRAEQAKVVRLINIAKPASFTTSVSKQEESDPSTSIAIKANSLPLFGKRKKIQVKFEDKSKYAESRDMDVDEDEDDREAAEKSEVEAKGDNKQQQRKIDGSRENNEERKEADSSASLATKEDSDDCSSSSDDEKISDQSYTSLKKGLRSKTINTFTKMESIFEKKLSSCMGKQDREDLETIFNNLRELASNEDLKYNDWKKLSTKKNQIKRLISNIRGTEPNENVKKTVFFELKKILMEEIPKVIAKTSKLERETQISKVVEQERKEEVDQKSKTDRLSVGEEPLVDKDNLNERKRKKNQRRIQQRQEKIEQEKQRGFEEDASRENYSMWLPPSGQSGDGKTSLNDKYGY